MFTEMCCPVERFLRNSKAPVIYEGTREIHTIMQAEYVLGYREDKALNNMLPAWPFVEETVKNSYGMMNLPFA